MYSLFMLIFFITMGSGIMSPLIGPLIFSEHGFFAGGDMGQKMQAYSLIMGIYALGMIIGNPVSGVISDKIGGKKAITLTLAGSILGYLLCLVSLVYLSFLLFFFARWLDGLMAGRRSIALSMISQVAKDKVSSFRQAEIANALGLLIGPIVSGLLANFSGTVPLYYYSIPFLIMLMIMTFNVFLVMKNVEGKPDMTDKVVKKRFFTMKLLSAYLNFFVLQLGWYLYFIAITPYIILRWKYTPIDVGFFFSTLICAYIFILLLVFPSVKKMVGEKKLSILALWVGGLAMLCMGVDSNNYYHFLIYNTGMVITMAFNTPIFMANIANLKKENEQGKTIGLQNSIIGFSWLFASILISQLSEVSIGLSFLLSGALLISMPSLQWLVKKHSIKN